MDTDQRIQPPRESYAFTNTSDRDITGVLTITPLPGKFSHAVTIRFTIPAGGSIFKIVGPGKDVSMPVESVGGATFVHNGLAGAVKADAYFVRESTLDVASGSSSLSIGCDTPTRAPCGVSYVSSRENPG